MYHGLLRVKIPICVELVAFDVEAVIIAKQLYEIRHLFDIIFEIVNLQLAKQKIEAEKY